MVNEDALIPTAFIRDGIVIDQYGCRLGGPTGCGDDCFLVIFFDDVNGRFEIPRANLSLALYLSNSPAFQQIKNPIPTSCQRQSDYGVNPPV